MKRYRVILADPPWQYEINSGSLDGLASRHMVEMGQADLEAIPVSEWAERDAVLAMWATWPQLENALALVRAWGFDYRTACPWIKTTPRGAIRPGTGFWVLGASEPILFGARGTSGVKKRENGKGWIGLLHGENRQFWAARPSLHSKKPRGLHEFLETFPGPYLELFAREERPGWDCWGLDTGFRLSERGVERVGRKADPQAVLPFGREG